MTKKTFPLLHTKRLFLREFKSTDAQAVFNIFSQEAVTEYYNREKMTTINEAEDLVEVRAGIFNHGVGVRWAIVMPREGNFVIGSCGIYKLDERNQSAEIGFDLHPDFWRRGIMTEALGAIISYGYSEDFFFYLNRFQALTYLDNTASRGLLTKLGFEEEGILRKFGHWKGQSHDLRIYSLLRNEWNK